MAIIIIVFQMYIIMQHRTIWTSYIYELLLAMNSILFTFVLIEGFLLILSDEGVNFGVKTTENSTCPDVDW